MEWPKKYSLCTIHAAGVNIEWNTVNKGISTSYLAIVCTSDSTNLMLIATVCIKWGLK